MNDREKILGLIENCSDPKRLKSWITNARNKGEARIADAAFRKLVSVLPKEEPGTVEYDFGRPFTPLSTSCPKNGERLPGSPGPDRR